MVRRSFSSSGVAIASALQQLPQNELEDASVAEIALLLGRVDAGDHLELLAVSLDSELARHPIRVGETADRECLAAAQIE